MTINRTFQDTGLGRASVNIELTDAELREAYEECEKSYRLADIGNHLEDMDMSELYGYSAEEIIDTPTLMQLIYHQFMKCQDCELPENDVMKECIRTVLADYSCKNKKGT